MSSGHSAVVGHFWQHCKPAVPHKPAHDVEALGPRRLLTLAAGGGGSSSRLCHTHFGGDRHGQDAQLVCAGLTASRPAIGTRDTASSLACVMPIREDGTHGDKQQKGNANRDDQVDPKIPAVTFSRHEWLMLMWPAQGADDSSVPAGLVPLESPPSSVRRSPALRPRLHAGWSQAAG
jgi:hypothetical protein